MSKLTLKYRYLFFLSISINFISIANHYDLIIVGQMKYAASMPRISIGLIDILKNDIDIGFINTMPNDFSFIDKSTCTIVRNTNKDRENNVALLVDSLYNKIYQPYLHVPKNSKIKLAYSMLESTAIPSVWVKILNAFFDAVIVPDKFLIKVYESSGVKIPIFVIPHGMILNDFIAYSKKRVKRSPFVFGVSTSFIEQKNNEILLKAFLNNYGHNNDFKLRIHGRWGDEALFKKLNQIVTNFGAKNVEIIFKSFSHKEYLDFLDSLSCYVLVSKGEGFSLTPREALLMGIPCILTDKLAHKTICDSMDVKKIACTSVDYFYNKGLSNKPIGFHFDCKKFKLQKAMQEVYENYEELSAKTFRLRKWVLNYSWQNLKDLYLNLIKPKKVILKNKNIITKDYIMTNSEKLYKKYLTIG